MFKKIWQLIVNSFQIWEQTNAARMSAAMTFYTILSLAPCLMIAVAIAGYMYEGPLVQAEITDQVRTLTDNVTADIVQNLLANATRPETGIIAGTISVLISIFGASGVFSQLYDTFNDIWHVPTEKRQGWFFAIQKRLIGIGVVVLVGVLLLATLVLNSVLAYLNSLLTDKYPSLVSWLNLADQGLLFLLMPVVFTAMFWFFPAAKVSWRDAWPAGVMTALLVSASRYLVAAYLQFSTTSEVYGAAGSLVVLLIWVYIIGLCVFYGASFSYAWAHIFGSKAGQPIARFGAWKSAGEADDLGEELEKQNKASEQPESSLVSEKTNLDKNAALASSENPAAEKSETSKPPRKESIEVRRR